MELFTDFSAASQRATELAAQLGVSVGVRSMGAKWVVSSEPRGTELFTAKPRPVYVPTPEESESTLARSIASEAENDARIARANMDRSALVTEERCNACDRPLSRCRC